MKKCLWQRLRQCCRRSCFDQSFLWDFLSHRNALSLANSTAQKSSFLVLGAVHAQVAHQLLGHISRPLRRLR
jgi:hypothetical protein